MEIVSIEQESEIKDVKSSGDEGKNIVLDPLENSARIFQGMFTCNVYFRNYYLIKGFGEFKDRTITFTGK